MRLISRVLASGIVLAVASIGAHAQGLCGARTPSGPIQYVSDAEFDQMVGGGTLPVTLPTMRFVPVKTDEQLDMQSLHRVRERWVMRRTAIINQIRGLLLERGITLRKGRHHVHAALPLILEDADANLSGAVRLLLTQLKLDLDQLSVRIDEADAVIQKTAHENEACQRLVAIPGIGPVTATALIAAIGNGGAFHKGREFAAWTAVFLANTPPAASRSCSVSFRLPLRFVQKWK